MTAETFCFPGGSQTVRGCAPAVSLEPSLTVPGLILATLDRMPFFFPYQAARTLEAIDASQPAYLIIKSPTGRHAKEPTYHLLVPIALTAPEAGRDGADTGTEPDTADDADDEAESARMTSSISYNLVHAWMREDQDVNFSSERFIESVRSEPRYLADCQLDEAESDLIAALLPRTDNLPTKSHENLTIILVPVVHATAQLQMLSLREHAQPDLAAKLVTVATPAKPS